MLDHEGRARREPDLFSLTRKSTFDRVTWTGWAGPTAVGTGWEIEFPCPTGCPDGYRATIVLSDLVRRQDAAYYRRAGVTSPEPLPSWAEDLRQVVLSVPDR